MKLLLTRELGRLATWLRILGFDAAYAKESNNASLVIRALREERAIVTRNHRLPHARGITIVTLANETIKKQIPEVLEALKVVPQREAMFTRCTVCNEPLEPIAKPQVRGKVPEYVFETQNDFFACPSCSRIYWHGTHWGNVERLLKEIYA